MTVGGSDPGLARGAWIDRATGALLCLVLIGTILMHWGAQWPWLAWATGTCFVGAIALMTPRVRWGRRAFVAVACVLTALALLRADGGSRAVGTAIVLAAFVAAFFSALTSLGKAAGTSPAVYRAGSYLALQPPGRRYLALTIGGKLFSLVLNYGSLPLLGSLAMSSLSTEKDRRIRAIRTRRMLLAIERAMVSTLTWSPLTYSVTLITLLLPGLSWGTIVLPGLVSGVIISGTGWALDMLFSPRRTSPRPPAATGQVSDTRGRPRDLLPLLLLLAILTGIVLGVTETLGIDVPGIVILVVPLVALGWIVIQWRGSPTAAHPLARARDYVFETLPDMRSELVLISMAAYIGSVGSFLAQPVAEAVAPTLSETPPLVILTAVIWVIIALGQLGMNPMLSVTLLIPALPSLESLGIGSVSMFLAVSAGWALSGISTPFSALAVIMSRFSGVSPRTVGLFWNGPFTLVCGILLTIWVLLFDRFLDGG